MKMNRVQFQPGLSMPEFFERYGTEAKCQAALQAARWPGGFACPRCGGAARTSFVRGGLPYWQCGACAHQCSLISGTIFEASKLALSRWFLAMQLLTQSKNNVSALELMRQLGVSYRSAWLMKHKIMEAMRLREEPRELSGRVEIDDAYLGGELSGGKAGRGSENKVPFVAAVQTTPSGQPVLACLRQQAHTEVEVAVFAASHIAPTATVVSDGLWCFGATTLVGAEHERHVTCGGKASVKLPQFEAINTLLGNLKTAISGSYHAFDNAQVRSPLPRRVPVPLQPPIQHEDHPVSFAHRPRGRPAVFRARAAGVLRCLANQVLPCGIQLGGVRGEADG